LIFASFPLSHGTLLTGDLWRVAAILAAVGLATTLLLPETLASTILRKKAARLNREGHDKAKRFIAPSDLVEEKPWTTYVSESMMGPW
jgi:hypothetical protein